MNKTLKTIIIILGCIVLIVMVPPIFMPSKYTAESSIVIKSTPYNVFPYFADLRNWEKWSPWKEKDPSTLYTYSENSLGAGSTMEWDSKNEELGTGKITTVQFKKFHHINYQLSFIKPFESNSGGQIMAEKTDDDQVRVTWTNTAKLKYPLERWFNVFMNFEKIIEKDFSKGLNNLKALVESNPQRILPTVNPQTIQLQEQYLLSMLHESVLNELVGDRIGESYGAILTTMQQKGIEVLEQPPICIYYKHNATTSTIRPALFVAGCLNVSLNNGIECVPLYGDKVLQFEYTGPYSKMQSTYDAIDMYIEENKLNRKRDYFWESYITDPGLEPDSNKWVTYIYVPIR